MGEAQEKEVLGMGGEGQGEKVEKESEEEEGCRHTAESWRDEILGKCWWVT